MNSKCVCHLWIVPVLALDATLGAQPLRTTSASPGEHGRSVEVEGRCPTFSWAATREGRGAEIVVLRMPADEDGADPEPTLVLRKVFDPGVTGWTPSLGECFERGADYAWTIRPAAGGPEQPLDSVSSVDWPDPLFFRISPLPSLAEVDQALDVLRAYREAIESSADAAGALATPVPGSAPARDVGDRTAEQRALAALAFDAVAMRGTIQGASGARVGLLGTSGSSGDFSAGVVGESTAATGFALGVVGSSHSAGGAGVAAFANDSTGGVGVFARAAGSAAVAIDAEADSDTGTAIGILARSSAPGGAALKVAHRDPAGGADLVLDGAQQGASDTVVTESGLSRSSGGAETFSFSNPGGGSLTLTLDGADLVTTATDQDTLAALSCTGGEIARWSGSAWTCAVDANSGGDITSVSAGSGLEGGGFAGDVGVGVAPLGITSAMLASDSVTSGKIAPGAVGATDVDSTAIQLRVGGSCPANRVVTGFGEDGSVECGLPYLPLKTRYAVPGAYVSPSPIPFGVDGLPVFSTSAGGFFGLVTLVLCEDLLCGEYAPRSRTLSSAGLRASMAVSSAGAPVVTWGEDAGAGLQLALCGDPSCSTLSTRALDPAASVEFTSLAMDGDLPVIAYYDAVVGDLKVARCDDVQCLTWSVHTVDSAGDVGRYPSLAIDAESKPVISYQDGSPNFDLRFTRCANAACSSVLSQLTLDSVGELGRYSSLVLSNGLPIIGYQDATNLTLKAAFCHDLGCVSSVNIVASHPSDNGFTGFAVTALDTYASAVAAFRYGRQVGAPCVGGSAVLITTECMMNAPGAETCDEVNREFDVSGPGLCVLDEDRTSYGLGPDGLGVQLIGGWFYHCDFGSCY